MITRDDSRLALHRFDEDVLSKYAEMGIVVYVRDGWRREWINDFHQMASWTRIIFKCEYGGIELKMEVCRMSEDDYRFDVKLFRPDNTWSSIWTISCWPMRGLRDDGFRFHMILKPEDYDVPF